MLQASVDEAVKVLLALKADYKKSTGQDWKPGATPPPAAAPVKAPQANSNLYNKITEQGDLVRKLKGEKASKVG